MFSLRLQGRNQTESDLIKLNQYHSVDISISSSFTLNKDCWEAYMDLLNEISSPIPKEHVIIITMQFGLANICLVGHEATIVVDKVEKSIPKKRQLVNGRDKAIIEFYRKVFESLNKQLKKFNYNSIVIVGRLDFVLVCVLLTYSLFSPGFLNVEFMAFAVKESQRNNNNEFLLSLQTKCMTCHTSTGYISAIDEIFQDNLVASRIQNLKLACEIKKLSLFFENLRDNESRVCYGLWDVNYAHSLCAIQDLLITDALYNSVEPVERNYFKELMKSIQDKGMVDNILIYTFIFTSTFSFCKTDIFLSSSLPLQFRRCCIKIQLSSC